MPRNIGYLTAKTDKASDEVFTAAFAVKPLLKYLCDFQQSKGRKLLFGVLLIQKKVNM